MENSYESVIVIEASEKSVNCDCRNFVIWDYLPLALGYYMYQIMKNPYKSEFKEVLLKLTANDQSHNSFGAPQMNSQQPLSILTCFQLH